MEGMSLKTETDKIMDAGYCPYSVVLSDNIEYKWIRNSCGLSGRDSLPIDYPPRDYIKANPYTVKNRCTLDNWIHCPLLRRF